MKLLLTSAGIRNASIHAALYGHPHGTPDNTLAAAERWAAGIGCPAYAIDDETALKVVDGRVEIVSEGHWKAFGRPA